MTWFNATRRPYGKIAIYAECLTADNKKRIVVIAMHDYHKVAEEDWLIVAEKIGIVRWKVLLPVQEDEYDEQCPTFDDILKELQSDDKI